MLSRKEHIFHSELLSNIQEQASAYKEEVRSLSCDGLRKLKVCGSNRQKETRRNFQQQNVLKAILICPTQHSPHWKVGCASSWDQPKVRNFMWFWLSLLPLSKVKSVQLSPATLLSSFSLRTHLFLPHSHLGWTLCVASWLRCFAVRHSPGGSLQPLLSLVLLLSICQNRGTDGGGPALPRPWGHPGTGPRSVPSPQRPGFPSWGL